MERKDKQTTEAEGGGGGRRGGDGGTVSIDPILRFRCHCPVVKVVCTFARRNSSKHRTMSVSMSQTVPLTMAPAPTPINSVPVTLHRSASFSPSLLVDANKLLSDRPQLIDCPRCKQHGHTELKFVSGLFTWVSFLVILVAGIFVLPLFFLWVPFFVETFKDVEHRCPNCKAHIGTFRRLGK